MDLNMTLLLGAVFLFAVSVIELLYLAWIESKFAEKRTVKKRLLYISAGGKHGQDILDKYKQKVLKEAGVLEKFLFALPRFQRLDRLLLNARIPINASAFIIFCLAFALTGAFMSVVLLRDPISRVLLAAALFSAPFLWLRQREKKTLALFEEQLPDALDLLCRALRSGQSLMAGMEIVGTEMDDPIKSEFEATVDEVNLGLSLKEALNNLTERIPSQDLRFFAIAVIIQKETGGNLAEIFENISKLIRERIQFRRQVQTLTAEGRLSGWILICLPIALFIYLYILRYDYISALWTEEMGIIMFIGAITLMFLGYVSIRRIVKIDI